MCQGQKRLLLLRSSASSRSRMVHFFHQKYFYQPWLICLFICYVYKEYLCIISRFASIRLRRFVQLTCIRFRTFIRVFKVFYNPYKVHNVSFKMTLRLREILSVSKDCMNYILKQFYLPLKFTSLSFDCILHALLMTITVSFLLSGRIVVRDLISIEKLLIPWCLVCSKGSWKVASAVQ